MATWSRNVGVTDAAPVLVIGVGSELRCDDAAGRRVAERIGDRGDDDVEVRSVHQLTPELAVDLAGREQVVIVDAAVDVADVTVRRIDPATVAPAFSHHLDPTGLLALAHQLGTAPRDLVTVSVPAHDLTLGMELSPATRSAVAEAAARVLALIPVGRSEGAGPQRSSGRDAAGG